MTKPKKSFQSGLRYVLPDAAFFAAAAAFNQNVFLLEKDTSNTSFLISGGSMIHYFLWWKMRSRQLRENERMIVANHTYDTFTIKWDRGTKIDTHLRHHLTWWRSHYFQHKMQEKKCWNKNLFWETFADSGQKVWCVWTTRSTIQ